MPASTNKFEARYMAVVIVVCNIELKRGKQGIEICGDTTTGALLLLQWCIS